MTERPVSPNLSENSVGTNPQRRREVDHAFDMLRNNRGQILLAIAARDEEPEDPRFFVFADAPYPIFRRTPDHEIGLPNLEDAALAWLAQVDKILIVEMKGSDLSRCYEAIVES